MSLPTTSVELVITNAGLNSLRQMVGGAGWAKTVDDICRGGQLLEQLPHCEIPKELPQMIVWGKEAVTIKLTPRQIDLAKKAVNYFVAQGAIPPTPSSTDLFIKLGLYDN